MTKDCKKDGTRKRPTKVVERKGKKRKSSTQGFRKEEKGRS